MNDARFPWVMRRGTVSARWIAADLAVFWRLSAPGLGSQNPNIQIVANHHCQRPGCTRQRPVHSTLGADNLRLANRTLARRMPGRRLDPGRAGAMVGMIVGGWVACDIRRYKRLPRWGCLYDNFPIKTNFPQQRPRHPSARRCRATGDHLEIRLPRWCRLSRPIPHQA